MREIKFRAWDKRMGIFIFFESLWNLFKEGEELEHNGNCVFTNKEHGLHDEDDFVFQQYTGLKDKNGKEIYEGDIVKSEQWEPSVYQICFDRGAFYIAKKDKHEVADIKYVEDFEVIGNIY